MLSSHGASAAACARLRKRTALSLAAFAAALVFCLPASAGIRIITESPRGRIFRGIYDLMPPCWHASGNVLVREVTDYEMDMLVGEDESRRDANDDSVVDGYYQPGKGDDMPTITLRRSIRDGSAELVFAHEYGHYVWDNKLTEKQRSEYRRIWAKQQRAGKLVTEYAADCVEEGFSEAVSHFLLRPSVLKRRDEASYHFVQVTIDDGMKHYRQANAGH